MQIQDADDTFGKTTDNVVTFECGVEEQDLDHVDFAQTLENPSIEAFLEVIRSGKNVLLVGAGGCGKTWFLKQLKELPMIRYTATTACAADLLGGSTIQGYILKNRKPTREVMVVDEVSMMGSILFEHLYDWSNKGKASDHAQLILSGDFL
jgi:MoxR-like ATPase